MITIGKLKLRGKTDDLPQYVQSNVAVAIVLIEASEEIGGWHPQLFPSSRRQSVLLPTSSQSPLSLQIGGSRSRIMDNYLKERMMQV